MSRHEQDSGSDVGADDGAGGPEAMGHDADRHGGHEPSASPAPPPPPARVQVDQVIDLGELSRWEPPDGVTLHDESRVPADMVFFATPPAAIGKVISAYSDMKPGDKPMAAWIRLLPGAFAAAIIAGVLYFVGLPPKQAMLPMAGLSGAIVLLVGLIGWALTTYERRCEFVGELGLASSRVRGMPDAPPRGDFFEFHLASDLRNSQTRNYTNGVYTGTGYHFTWTDPAGKQIYKIDGSYRNEAGNPPSTDRFWFGRSAQAAWNMFLFEAIKGEFEDRGYVQFNVRGKDFLLVGPGYLEFHFSGKVERVEHEQIKSMSLNQGHFHIETTNATGFSWITGKGRFSFDYGQMSNAQLFLFSLEKLMGYKFG